MTIPVDSVLVEGNGVFVDEAIMTGETQEFRKETLEQCEIILEEQKYDSNYNIPINSDIPSPILISGTRIITGEGWFMAVVVGKNSCISKITSYIKMKARLTPLQYQLIHLQKIMRII